MLGYLALDDLGAGFDPLTEQLTTHIAGCHADMTVVADALGLAGIGRAVNVQFFWRTLRRVSRKPHWGANALPILAKRFQVDVLVSLQWSELGISHKGFSL